MFWITQYWPRTYLTVGITAFVISAAVMPIAIRLLRRFQIIDAVSAEKIEMLLLHLRSERNLTMIWVTHEREQAERIGGRRLILRDGRLEENHE